MTDEQNWENPLEDDGTTLGPEEALSREIEKSKRLKVERLKLRDEIEKLQAKNDALMRKNQALEKQVQLTVHPPGGQTRLPETSPFSQTKPAFAVYTGWACFLLIFNLMAMGFLLYFLLQK